MTAIDNEARGRLRLWKAGLARRYATVEALCSGSIDTVSLVGNFIHRSSEIGRRRGFERLRKILANSASLEGVRLSGKMPTAVWSVLKPRESVSVNGSAAETQNCVTVNYLLISKVTDHEFAEGLWSVEVPDHALGRLMQRAPATDPSAVVLALHHTALRLCVTDVMPDNVVTASSFLIGAGRGAFICEIDSGFDVSVKEPTIFIRAITWIDDDQIRPDQIVLREREGSDGPRLGDTWLLPKPLRTTARQDNTLHMMGMSWVMPSESMLRPAGSA